MRFIGLIYGVARVMTASSTPSTYVHGYTAAEQDRLRRQARITERLIYRDVDFMDNRNVLEIGCGVGAQTEILLRRFPEVQITGIDLNPEQLATAETHLAQRPWCPGRYQLIQADATQTGFADGQFDGAFLCWVLEHIPAPLRVVQEAKRVLAPRSPVYVTEVMNASFFLDPYSPAVWQYWMAFNDYQYEVAGDPFVGAKLGNLLTAAGFRQVRTRIKTFHYDNRQPARRKAMIAFWEELLLSAADSLITAQRVTPTLVDDMRQEFRQVQNDPNAVFFYSFVQAHAKA